MKRRYRLTIWLTGSYSVMGTEWFWTLRGARRTVAYYNSAGPYNVLDYTISNTRTGKVWHP